MTDFSTLKSVTFEYDTLVLPPPHAHRYTLKVQKDATGNATARLTLEYYGRGEISKEEIMEEGYTPDDDYEWKGALPAVWVKAMEDKLRKANWVKNPKATGGPALSIRVSTATQAEVRYPDQIRPWEIFIQEVIQAIFEIGGKEAPLHISIVLDHKSPKSHNIDIEFSFAQRTVTIHPSGEKSRTIPWDKGQKLMKYIYAIDYLPEQALEKLPKSHGSYISPGDGFWYDLSPEKEPNKGNTERIKRLLELLGEL